MNGILTYILIVSAVLGSGSVPDQQAKPQAGEAKAIDTVSFQKNVFPLIKKNCLPCHAEDNFNPSELTLDSYDMLMSGGKHGSPVVPGNSRQSILAGKLSEKPPFGDRMPLDLKKKRGEVSTRRLTDEEIKIITDWIDQGAKNN